MPHFSKASKEKLKTLDPELQDVLEEAIKHTDFTIVWGHRDMEAQNTAFANGKSRNRWPTSKHNSFPSNAVDIVPYPGLYDSSYSKFFELSSYILAIAAQLGVPLRWGGHWINYTGKGHYDRDWAHYEIIE